VALTKITGDGYGAGTITTSDNSNNLTLTSTDADANVGPVMLFKRDSSSPADNDFLGYTKYSGENDADEATIYAQTFAQIIDASDGTEDGSFSIGTIDAGTLTTHLVVDSSGVDITGGFTATAASTITTSDNSNNLTLTSTDADANTGPNLVMTRASGSPADNDAIGELTFNFNNDAAENTVGTRWRNFIIDASDTTEDAAFDIFSMKAGSLTSIINYDSSTIIINDSAANIDFRVESLNSSNMLLVNAATNRVLISDDNNVTDNNNANFCVNHSASTRGVNLHTTGTGGSDRITFQNDNGTVGSIATSGSSTSYATSSDYRLKENVDYTWDATTRLKQLKPARFNFIADDTNTLVDGFLAHEVSSVVPEAINGTKNETRSVSNAVLSSTNELLAEGITQDEWTAGKDDTYPSDSTWTASHTEPVMQGIDQSKLVPLLVKTIQELEARIVALESA